MPRRQMIRLRQGNTSSTTAGSESTYAVGLDARIERQNQAPSNSLQRHEENDEALEANTSDDTAYLSIRFSTSNRSSSWTMVARFVEQFKPSAR